MKLSIPEGEFKAYLFDCDGTIADSMPLQHQAWLKAMEEWGGVFPEELFYGWAGIPIPKTVEMLNQKFGLSMPPLEVARRREQAYYSLMKDIKPMATVVEHIEAQHGRIPFAVVSGSPRASIIKTLSFLGLLEKFDLLVGAEDYSHGKPHPEPFLTAAQGLGVKPENCLVFEDADLGIASAQAAGMKWVKVPQPSKQTGGGVSTQI